tara:strand:+ start:3648 stop:5516 length:1869 start_codon:yes stop_codon:yes gene_type:complete
MSGIEAAIEALESLELGESFKYSEYAKKYNCSRSTLSKRHRGVQQARATTLANGRLLNTTQEKQLVQTIHDLTARGLPPSRPMIRNFASQIANKDVGHCWANRFVQRHHIELISHWASGLDRNRFKADSAFKYSLYFELLKRKIEQYNIDSRHIYNMDEKGFLIGISSKVKRVFSRSAFEQGKLKHIVQDGNREWITTIACICADGSALTPTLIYQAQHGAVQDTWLQDFDASQHKAFFTSSLSGWTNNDIGLAWLKQVFDRETKSKARSTWRLLILDGHGSHVTMDFIQYCDANKILLMVYPPHSTHTLQPLDVVMFAPLAASYKAELLAFLEGAQGLTGITKRDFYRLFNAAWTSSFNNKLIAKAFAATGISPLNPDVILSRFATASKDASRPSSSGSSTSVLSASDWRKIERLLRQAVDNIYDVNAKKLSRTIHTISAKNSVLQHEINNLREALANEKKRRKRSKALLLEAPAEYDGGAVCWSPAKVEQARQRQEQKDLEEQRLQHQKSEAIKLREQQKIAKALLLEERRVKAIAAKEKRAADAAAKVAAREDKLLSRQLEEQLQSDLTIAQKGKRQSLKLPKAVKSVVVAEERAEVEEAGMATTRRGRPIRLPKKLIT